MTEERKLRKSDLLRCFLIWETTSESCLSYERLMSVGFCHAMVPIINRLYLTKEERLEAMKRHLVFFNTENNWGAFIPGIVCSLEEEMANGGNVTGEAIVNIKTGLMGPLAGIGDTITQGLMRTIALAIGVDMTLGGNPLGPLVFFLIYATYIAGIGILSFTQGYKVGRNVLAKISDPKIMKKLMNCLSILGMTITGAMMVNNVKIVTPLTITIGETVVSLQDQLNAIAPGMLSVIAVLVCFTAMRKKVSVSKIMICIFIVATLGSLIGIL